MLQHNLIVNAETLVLLLMLALRRIQNPVTLITKAKACMKNVVAVIKPTMGHNHLRNNGGMNLSALKTFTSKEIYKGNAIEPSKQSYHVRCDHQAYGEIFRANSFSNTGSESTVEGGEHYEGLAPENKSEGLARSEK
ncbi:hypothetical protein WN943_023358 [Citrus x changshan-huyou]